MTCKEILPQKEERSENMHYPKPIMKITQLNELGFSRDFLNRAVHHKGQGFAHKTSEKGDWLIDTDEFEKWRLGRI